MPFCDRLFLRSFYLLLKKGIYKKRKGGVIYAAMDDFFTGYCRAFYAIVI